MPIDMKHLEIVMFEAERFFERARACYKDMKECAAKKPPNPDAPSTLWPDTRLSAAVRRSSMDLTRALAQLRKA